MSNSDPHQPDQVAAPQGRRRRWGLFLPLIAILVLAAGWSAYWFVAASTAQTLVDAWFEREAQRGRTYACERRDIAGYPFRIELTCEHLSLVAGPPGQQTRYAADRLHAVAQVYNFKHMIAEITGPVIVSDAARPDAPLLRADWTLAQASVILSLSDLDHAALSIKDPMLWAADGEGLDEAAEPLFTADALELHSRLRPGGTPHARDYDIAATLRNAAMRADADPLDSPISRMPSLTLTGTVFALPGGMTDNVRDNMRAWQANGGRLELTLLRADLGAALAHASGGLSLTDQGYVDGEIAIAVAGADSLIAAGEGGASNLLSAFGIIGKSVTIEERDAIEIALNIKAGDVGSGPLSLFQLPPLF